MEGSYRRDLFVLDSREAALTHELKTGGTEDIEKREELENRLDKVRESRVEIAQGLSRCEARSERLQETVERYQELKQELAVDSADIRSRYLAVSNTEKEAAGRTDRVEYIPQDVDRSIREVVAEERTVLMQDVERYNEKNPDNPIRERDGELYNRFGISESGKYDPEMCDLAEKPERDEVPEEYLETHQEDGFKELKEEISGEKKDSIEVLEDQADKADVTKEPPENKEPEKNVDKEVEDKQESKEESADTGKEPNVSREETDDKKAEAPSDVEAPSEDRKEPEAVSEKDQKLEDQREQQAEVVEAEQAAEDKENVPSDSAIDDQDSDAYEVQQSEGENTDTEGGYTGEVPESADVVTDDSGMESGAPLDPVSAARMEDAGDGDEVQNGKKEERIGKKEDQNSLSEEIREGFLEYLDSDTYSFSDDLITGLGGDALSEDTEKIMLEALCELYSNGETAQEDRLYSLTMEVATFSDNGVMNVIEDLVDGLKEAGISDYDLGQTLTGLEPVVCNGIDELTNISVDGEDQRTLRIGEEAWTVTPDSIISITTGESEDPNHLIDLIADSVDELYGKDIGNDTAVQTLDSLQEYGSADNGLDFLDQFFGGKLEETLQQVLHDLIPESVADQFEAYVEKPEEPGVLQEIDGIQEDYFPEDLDFDFPDDAVF